MNADTTADIEIAGIFRDISRKPYYGDQAAVRKLNARFAARDGRVAEIPISRLIATQATVRSDYDESWQRYNDTLPTDLPVVIRYDNAFYVSDGHHRIVAQHHKGVKVVRVFLIDLDDMGEIEMPLLEPALFQAVNNRSRSGGED